MVQHLITKVRDIRRIGVGAIDLCYVACGRLDAVYERGLNPWDYGAGALIASEAGATVGGLHGAPVSPEMSTRRDPGGLRPAARRSRGREPAQIVKLRVTARKRAANEHSTVRSCLNPRHAGRKMDPDAREGPSIGHNPCLGGGM